MWRRDTYLLCVVCGIVYSSRFNVAFVFSSGVVYMWRSGIYIVCVMCGVAYKNMRALLAYFTCNGCALLDLFRSWTCLFVLCVLMWH